MGSVVRGEGESTAATEWARQDKTLTWFGKGPAKEMQQQPTSQSR